MHLLKKKTAIVGIAVLILLLIGLTYVSSSFKPEIPVLNYHQVNNDAHNLLTLSTYQFETQIAYLYNSGYTTITPTQLADYLQYGKELPPNPILITFDDGYEDNYQMAYPILQKYHFTATIFLITDFVSNDPKYLTWEQVNEMFNNGFTFESHTLNHLSLPNASDEEIRYQFIKSKEAIEWCLGQKVEYLAYPGGEYNRQVINLAKQTGYRAGFTVNLGRDTAHCELFTLNRIPIFEGSHTFLHFWLRLKFTQALNNLQNLKTFLRESGAISFANLIYIP